MSAWISHDLLQKPSNSLSASGLLSHGVAQSRLKKSPYANPEQLSLNVDPAYSSRDIATRIRLIMLRIFRGKTFGS